MTQAAASSLIQNAWEYPLFEALYGRRSRRFGLGFEITEGPFKYSSQSSPMPLNELEEGLLVAAGVGVTGTPLWDTSRPRALGVGDGRTFGSTMGGRRTALFLTNDDGVHVIEPSTVSSTKIREVETRDEREKVVAFYRHHRKKVQDSRLEIPRHVPPLFAHNFWDSNMPGCTLFMPVCDVSESLIALTAQLVDGEGGRFAAKQGGGMYVVDDRHGFRPAGTEKWANSGFLDRNKVLPLSVLEREACYFIFNEPAIICQNIFLATEALGVGGWMHCGFLSLGVLEALGFRTVMPGSIPALSNPIGLDGVFEGYCPPYFRDMDAAVDAAVSQIRPAPGSLRGQPGPTPYAMSDADYRADILELSDEGVACTKAICNYIYDTFGRFPGMVDTMHLMWFMQVHHLDLDFYDRYFKAGVCGKTHMTHMATWHP
jgi:hypothetical protein